MVFLIAFSSKAEISEISQLWKPFRGKMLEVISLQPTPFTPFMDLMYPLIFILLHYILNPLVEIGLGFKVLEVFIKNGCSTLTKCCFIISKMQELCKYFSTPKIHQYLNVIRVEIAIQLMYTTILQCFTLSK